MTLEGYNMQNKIILETIQEHLEAVLPNNERELKRIIKGGGAFPYVNFIAIYENGVLKGTNISFGKTVDTYKEGYTHTYCNCVQTDIQKAFLLEDVRIELEKGV